MGKVLVVVEAPYSVPDSSGHHLVPGEIAEIEDTPVVRSRIRDGQLTVVRHQTTEPPAAKPEETPPAKSAPAIATKTRAPGAQTDQES
jgi:hypothetical protein